MKRIAHLLPLLLLLITSSVFGQVPVIQWQRLLGGPNGDYAGSIRQTTDGGYIVAGYSESNGGDVVGYHGNLYVNDIWVVKLDAAGAVQWTRCLGGKSVETGADIHQTADGGYILAGSSASTDCGMAPGHGGLDFWLVKLTSTGDIQWQKMYGGSLNEYATSLSMAADGGYFIGGYTNSGNQDVTGYHDNGDPYNNFDWWIIKVDATGNLQWEKTLGGTGNDQCNSVQATPDGGCIAAGVTVSSNGDVTGFHGGNGDAWLVRLSSTGTVQWQKTYGGTQADGAQGVQLTSDGNYIFAGFAGSNDGDVSGNHQPLGGPDLDYWVVKITPTGGILWQKCYGGEFNESAYSIRTMSDGGYVIGGTAESSDGDLSCNAGITDAWIIKIDATGNLVWSKSMGGSYYDQIAGVEPLSDGSFIMAGSSCSLEFPGYHPHTGPNGTCDDYWIVKLSAPLPIAPPPLVTLSPSSGNICPGFPATFTANAVNTGVVPAYAWTLNSVPVGTNSPTYSASNFKNGDVLVVSVTAATGPCANDNRQNTASVTINTNTNNLSPTINITPSTNFFCDCAPVLFKSAVTGGGAAPSYMWMLNGTPTGNTAPNWLAGGILPTDLISCQYSDASGCIAGGVAVSNDVSLQAASGGGTTVLINGPSNYCPGDLVTLTAFPVNGGVNPSYQWQVNGINAGTNSPIFSSQTLLDGDKVTCILTPDPTFTCANGVLPSKPYIIAHKAAVALTIQVKGPSGAYCQGQDVTFQATAVNISGHQTYQWTVNGQPVGANSPSLTQAFNDGDIVQCTMTDPSPAYCLISNTVTSTPITVQVLNQPAPSVSISATGNNACAGNDIAFTATVGNAGSGSSVQWLVNGTPAGSPGAAFTGKLKNNDLVTCQLTPGTGVCSMAPILSNAITAVVFPLPSVTITPADTTVSYGSQVTLNASVSSDVSSYQWAPAGLLTNGLSLSTPTVPLTADVSISLAVSNAEQCTATAVAVIKIGHPLVMPNAFSPNGDGINDVFRIPAGTNLQLQEFQIYDRWGNKVFATRNINTGWDGTISGSPAPTGTYVYFVIGSDNRGPVKYKGTVVLVR